MDQATKAFFFLTELSSYHKNIFLSLTMGNLTCYGKGKKDSQYNGIEEETYFKSITLPP
jgi:hypothetical protein